MCVQSGAARGILVRINMEDIFSFGNIYRCYLACRKNKRNTINALKFEINAEEDILKLERELKAKAYRPSRSILFAARRPKLREIFAADFRDRVVHHILVDYLERIWEKVFIYDSYACRKGKGTHEAVMRLQSFLRKVSKNGNILINGINVKLTRALTGYTVGLKYTAEDNFNLWFGDFLMGSIDMSTYKFYPRENT